MNFLLKAAVTFPLVIASTSFAQAQTAPTSLLTSAIVAEGDAPLAQTDVATLPSTVDFDILSCPFAIFREAYLGVFETSDRLAIMALEDEAIGACAKRQTQVNLVLKQEQELRELLEQSIAMGSQEAAARANAEPETTIEPAVDANVSVAVSEPEQTDDVDQSVLMAQMARAVKEAQDSCTFEYGVQSAGHQLDGDGNFGWATIKSSTGDSFVVKKDDLLPGNLRIKSVSKTAVFVQGADGSARQLPKAPFENAEVIDLNFTYTLTPLDKLNTAQAGE